MEGNMRDTAEKIKAKICMNKINELISKLQIYGYRIIINNHNIGDYHNIYVQRYMPIDIIFFSDTYELRDVDYYVLRLPEECNLLVEELETLLINASHEG